MYELLRCCSESESTPSSEARATTEGEEVLVATVVVAVAVAMVAVEAATAGEEAARISANVGAEVSVGEAGDAAVPGCACSRGLLSGDDVCGRGGGGSTTSSMKPSSEHS